MLKSAGLGIGLVALVVAIVLASQVEKTLLTSSEQILMFYILTAIFTNVLPIISVPLAFMAKPKTVRMIAVANVPQLAISFCSTQKRFVIRFWSGHPTAD